MAKFYNVILISTEGDTIASNCDVEGLKAAKQSARDYLTDPEYAACDIEKVEVWDVTGGEAGTLEWDAFAAKA